MAFLRYCFVWNFMRKEIHDGIICHALMPDQRCEIILFYGMVVKALKVLIVLRRQGELEQWIGPKLQSAIRFKQCRQSVK